MISEDILEKIPGFVPLSNDTKRVLSERAFFQNKPAEASLLIEGMPAEYCYFILSGSVRVIRMNREGRIQVIARFGPGSALNVISMLSEEKLNRSSIETLTDVKLIAMDANCFNLLIQQHPDFSKMLLLTFAERMAKMVDLVSDLSLHTVRSRLARFLIDLADQPQSAGGWTQDEIAAHIGTVRDVVGRLLREFEAEGLIQRDRQQILLLDRKRLFNEAEMPEG